MAALNMLVEFAADRGIIFSDHIDAQITEVRRLRLVNPIANL